MSEPTNDPRDQQDEQRMPTFVGGSFGVTSRELEGDAGQDPVAAFREVEDAEDTGPDILAAGTPVPETLQQDVSHAQDGDPADVEGISTEPSPGDRNDPV